MPSRSALLLALSALLLAGCSSAAQGGGRHPQGTNPSGARHEYPSRAGALVRIDASTAERRADAAINQGDVVCWLNASTDRPVRIEIGAAIPDGCDTYGASGFRVAGSATVTDPLLVPGCVASLAFPEAGTYACTITGLNAPIRGTIRVTAPPPPPTPAN